MSSTHRLLLLLLVFISTLLVSIPTTLSQENGTQSEGSSENGGSSEGESSSNEGGSENGGQGEGSGGGDGGSTSGNGTVISSSSSSYSSGFCFSDDSIVQRLISMNDESGEIDWEYCLLRDIKQGDFVLSSYDGVYSEVLHRLHYIQSDGSNDKIAMRHVCTYNTCLKLTNDHLIYKNGNELDQLVPAKMLNVGDLVWNQKLNTFEAIVSIEDNVMAYPRDVLTESGNIVVNDILASSYIGSSKWDHIMLEKIMKWLRALANDLPEIAYQIIADGPAIWKNEEITSQIHQFILFSYFKVYQPIVQNLLAFVAISGFGMLVLKRNK